MIKQFLWLTPFICFLGGYLCLFFFIEQKTLQAPSIVGLPIGRATVILSKQNLNIRIIAQKDETWTKQEIILSQNPKPGCTIKANQSIYCVISKPAADILMPNFIDKHRKEIKSWCKQHGLSLRSYYFETNHPENICFAQYPECGEQITDSNGIIVYFSQ